MCVCVFYTFVNLSVGIQREGNVSLVDITVGIDLFGQVFF